MKGLVCVSTELNALHTLYLIFTVTLYNDFISILYTKKVEVQSDLSHKLVNSRVRMSTSAQVP